MTRTCTVCGAPACVFDGKKDLCASHGWDEDVRDASPFDCEPGCMYCREDRGEPALARLNDSESIFTRLAENGQARVDMMNEIQRSRYDKHS